MGMLRQKGAVDPGTSAQRLPELGMMQGSLGANIPQQGMSMGPGAPLPDQPSAEEGAETDMTAPVTALPIIIDALNESIIALKAEIHRTQEPEGRRQLEKLAGQLRTHIQDLGGEPIWADESIEEGLQKLTGHGYVGQDRLQMITGGIAHGLGLPESAQQMQPPVTRAADKPRADSLETLTKGVHGVHAAGKLPTFPSTQGATQLRDLVQIGSPDDYLSSILKQIGGSFGGGGGASAAPTPTVNIDFVNQVLESMGVSPRSPEEISAHAHAIVERMKLSKEQVVQRELDRFERDNPPEFARAQEQIMNAAKTVAAEDQEDFASRGMFYASVMASAVEGRKAVGMEEIAKIANSAASYVIGLEEELRDIAEWAIVEEEVLRRELEAEDQQLRTALANLKIQVGQWGDQMALDAWYQQESINLQHRQLNIQAAQASIQAAMQLGDHYSAAFLLRDPMIAEGAASFGFSIDQISQMPLPQQAALAESVINSMGLNTQRDRGLLEDNMLAVNIALAEADLADHPVTRAEASEAAAAEKAASKVSLTDRFSSLWDDYPELQKYARYYLGKPLTYR